MTEPAGLFEGSGIFNQDLFALIGRMMNCLLEKFSEITKFFSTKKILNEINQDFF